MADFQIGPWPVGIDMVSEVTDLPKGAVVDALNGVFVKGGAFVTRPGELQVVMGGVFTSTWQSNDGTYYAMEGASFGTVDFATTPPSFTPIATLKESMPVSYADLNGDVIIANNQSLYRYTNGTVIPLGVEPTGAFSTLPVANGGMDPGTYGVAISFFNSSGEEGPLSQVEFVTVPAGGGIQFNLPTPLESATAGIRIYRTEANGEQLYQVAVLPFFPTTYLIGGDARMGKIADTQYKIRMLGGQYLSVWQGRLLVARGRTLYISDPMRYGLCDPRHGFVQMPYKIVFIGTFPTGIFIGTTTGVYFLAGSSPDDFQLQLVDEDAPMGGACMSVNVERFQKKESLFPQGTDYVQAWLGSGGFHFGLPSGAIVRPQNDRIDLDMTGTYGTLQMIGDVLTAIVY